MPRLSEKRSFNASGIFQNCVGALDFRKRLCLLLGIDKILHFHIKIETCFIIFENDNCFQNQTCCQNKNEK